MKKIFFSFFCLIFMLNCPLATADTIYLNNGKVVFGDIKEKGSYYVIFVENGIEHKYYDSEIQKIEESQPKSKPLVNTAINSVSQDKKALVDKLLELNGSKKAFELTIENMMSQIPEDKKEDIAKIFNINTIMNNVIPLYDRYFTREELNAILVFYQSEAGKKLIEYTPKIMQETMSTLLGLVQDQLAN